MDKEISKKAYLKGYEDGLREVWNEIIKLTTKGFTMSELRMMAKSRLAVIYQKVGSKSRNFDAIYATEIEKGAERAGTKEVEMREGETYLIKEERPRRSLALFADLVKRNQGGLAITRMYPASLEKRFDLSGARLLWLSKAEIPGETAERKYEFVSPTDLVALHSIIMRHLKDHKGHPVLLEGIEYMISQNNFSAVLRFLQKVSEYVVLNNGILLVPTNPSALSTRDYMLLAREMGGEI